MLSLSGQPTESNLLKLRKVCRLTVLDTVYTLCVYEYNIIAHKN